MNERVIGLGALAAGLFLAGCSDTGTDGAAAGAAGTAMAQTAAATPASIDGEWRHPVTEWGDPDLRGMWPTMHLIATQFQRNPQYGDRRYLTDEEYAELREDIRERGVLQPVVVDDEGNILDGHNRVRIAREFGREPATIPEARAIFGLPARTGSNIG